MSAADRIRRVLATSSGGTVYAVEGDLLREALAELVSYERQINPPPRRPDEPLVSARIGRMNGNRDVKPADLCRAMAHDIDTGALKADGLVLVWMWRPEEGDWDCGRYLANMRSDQELVALELAKQSCMDKWRRT